MTVEPQRPPRRRAHDDETSVPRENPDPNRRHGAGYSSAYASGSTQLDSTQSDSTQSDSTQSDSTQSGSSVQPYNSAGGSLGDDDSELLRWRADQLLDEMMLGGVDVSAADLDGKPPHTHNAPANGNGIYHETNHTAATNTAATNTAATNTAATNTADYNSARDSGGRDSREDHRDGDRSNGYHNGAHGASSPSAPVDDSPVDDFEVFFDAFDESPPKPAGRHPIPPVEKPQDSPQNDDIFAPRPSRYEARPDPATHVDRDTESRYPDAKSDAAETGSDAAWARIRGGGGAPEDSAGTTGSFIRSKVGEADYLSRRYGYTDAEDEDSTASDPYSDPYSDPDYVDPLDRVRPGGPVRRGDEPRESSRDYYERQRVDREERMSSAERRPDQPMHGTQPPGGAAPATNDGFSTPGPRASDGFRANDGPVSRRGRDYDAQRPQDSRPQDLRPQDLRSRDDYRLPPLDLDDAMPSAAKEPERTDTQWIHQAKEKWNWQDVSGVARQVEPEVGSGAASLHEFELAGYDRDPRVAQNSDSARARPVGSMTSVNGKLRSPLLPRMTSTSVDTLHEQMNELHQQIDTLLPTGHEYRERAYHLLEKAGTILHHDPSRSAEVEYYLQQARGIVQRQEHAVRLSGLYRQRLQYYLGAWLALSGLALLARYIFQFEFDAILAGTFSLDYAGFVLQNAAAFTGSLFAGALGGSVGALLTLARHIRRPHGYVDRKYGLRGLILPIIGLLAGALIYLPFGLFFSVIGLDPSLNVIAASISAVCAFAFGFNQESLYGTRD